MTFNANGRIDITARVARIIGISTGDVIDVAVEGGEYYLYVVRKAEHCVGRHEGRCYPTKHGSHNFRAYSKRLCQAVMRLSGATLVASLPAGESALILGGTRQAVILIVRSNLSED